LRPGAGANTGRHETTTQGASERNAPTRELLNLIDRIGKAGASVRSIGDPLWDTSSAQGRLLSTLLASIAEFERELIRERTGEGR
jgi:DNA invertase Pin-like site-specific DNA recombinase